MIRVFLFVLVISSVTSYRFLGLFPHPGKSHWEVFRPLVEELAARGHKVTVVSFFPRPSPLRNYVDVSLEGLETIRLDSLPIEDALALGPLDDFSVISQIGLDTCRAVLPSQQIRDLVESNTTYDLILTELFTTDCFLAVVDLLGAPFIALSSSSVFPTTDSRFGCTANPSYVPNMFLPYSDSMTFTQRIRNSMTSIVMHLYKSYYYDEEAESIAREVFGEKIRPLNEVAKETRLLLANRHFSLNRPRPLQPAVIEVGGLHIRSPKPLPSDIETFINESREGVIYFSMGSVLLAKSFPEEKRRAFVQAFSRLQQRVLWKYEEDMPDRPPNVLLSKWLPQRDILEHENVILFISHGGYLSASEAVHCGVPVLGIPMYGDQGSNLAALEAAGTALILPFASLHPHLIHTAISTIIDDQSYYERAKELSRVFKDRPESPLEAAVYWTEYAARRRTWPMGSAAARLTWAEATLLDAILLLLLSVSAVFFAVYLAASCITNYLLRLIVLRGLSKKEKAA